MLFVPSLLNRITKKINFFGVEDRVVRFKEAMDGGFVKFHFQAADADCTVAKLAVVFGRLVLGREAADAGAGRR